MCYKKNFRPALGLIPAMITILIFFYLPLKAQFTVRGSVKDASDGQPLTGAHIQVGNTFITVVSGTDGTFHLSHLKKGEYSLVCSFMGFRTEEVRFRLTKDTTLSVAMVPKPILGEEVNIIATRAQPKTPATFSTLTPKEIDKVNLGKDMPYILQSTPSVVVTSDAGTGIGYTGINIRGTDLTRINVTLNGIPMNDPESQGVWFVDIPDLSSSTDNIQVQRGVGTSTNGAGAFGASINIRTTDLSQTPYGELNSSAGSFSTYKNTFRFGSGLIANKFAFDGRISYISSEGYIDRAYSRLGSFYLSGGYLGKNTTVKFNILSGLEKTYQAWEGVPKDSLNTNRTYNPAGEYTDRSGKLAYYSNQTDNYNQTYYQLLFSQKAGTRINLNLALHYTKGTGYYENYEQDKSFSSYGLNNVIIGSDTITSTNLIDRKMLDNDFFGITFSGNYDNRKNLQLTIGGAWNTYNGRHMGKIIWAQYASNSDNETNWYYGTGKKKDFNIFVKATYHVIPKLTLYADLQYRHVNYVLDGSLDDLRTIDQKHLFDFINPKAGVYYDISDNQNVYFSFGIANREPSRDNYKDADPGQIPNPERLYDYELGYNLNLKNFRTGVNLYFMDYKDQLVLTGKINNVGEAIMTNVPHSYRAGIEITAGASVFHWLKWNIAATLSRNKIESFTEYVDAYDSLWNFTGQVSHSLGETDLSFSPSFLFTNGFTFIPVKNLSIDLISRYVGRQFIDNTASKDRSLDPWFVNDLAVAYVIHTKVFSDIGFNLRINNLFSDKYESNAWIYRYYFSGKEMEMNGYFPQAPVHFLFGLTLKIG
jgi:iron complex outermembrane recepter protein